MSMKKTAILLIAIAITTLFIACDSNDPSDEKGTLHVISDPDSASILIDGTLQTGKYTNTTFELDPGNYTIRVAKSGYDSSPESTIVEINADVIDTVHFILSEMSDTGYIFVDCPYDDAPVFIDGIMAGFSNEYIESGAGIRNVRIDGWAFNSATETIALTSGDTATVEITPAFVSSCLIEEFSHVHCSNCPDAAEAVQTVLSAYGDSVLAIEWHPNLAGIDPFRADNPAMHDGRGAYYDVTGMPQVFVAGNVVPDPTSSTVISSSVSNALSNSDVQNFKLWARVIDESSVRVNCEVQTGTGTGLFKLVVVENSRHFDTAPGSNGMTDFHNIARRMTTYPTTGTTEISSNASFTMDYEVPEDLGDGEYHIVIWFQKDADGIYTPGEAITCSPCRAEF